ncbi:MAG: hypothetical protein Q4G34_02785 [Micrococcus sp.]|nr:hypothetical protein [Micrococcus sp.]
MAARVPADPMTPLDAPLTPPRPRVRAEARPTSVSARLRPTSAHTRLLGVAGALLLAVSACSSEPETQPSEDPHASVSTATPGGTGGGAGDGASVAPGSAEADTGDAETGEAGTDGAASDEQAAAVVESLELGERKDQVMAEAAAQRAATFGFVRQRAATAEEIAQTREDNRARLSDAARTVVEPAACKAPITALDFSPILLDSDDVTRVDVGADSFVGTGTIEIARLDGPARQRVERHLQTVNTLVSDCPEMTMTVTEGATSVNFTLTTSTPELSEGSTAQSGLIWQRWPVSDETQKLTAQVLTTTTPDAVIMVSFAGQEAAGERQFTVMAEEIIAAAQAAG